MAVRSATFMHQLRSARPGLGALPPVPVRSSPLVPLAPTRQAGIAAAGEPAEVELRLLLLAATGDEPSLQAAGGALTRIGVPFTTLIATQEEILPATLWTEQGGCRYVGVVLVQSEVGYEDEQGTWGSALDAGEWQLLDDYELACNVREVAWYAWPGSSNGLEPVSEFQGDDRVPARITASGAGWFPYLEASAPVELADAWGYRARIVDAATTTALLETEAGEALAVVHRRADGREVLAMTFDSSQWTRHSLLLEYGIIDWVSRGLFLGARRIYLTPQIDDVFIDAELWGSPDASYRTSAADVHFIADWQRQAAARLPAGSTFVTQMVFNGFGTDPDSYPDQAPIDAWRARQEEFVWVNHTWDHVDMDPMSTASAQGEVGANCELAADWELAGFSCGALVTPEISGLDSEATLDGIIAAGVDVVVSDTSVTEAVNPDNPGNNPSPNVGRRNPWRPELYQVPRHPTNVFFNCSTVAEEVDLFNYLYRAYFGRELSYPEMVALDAEVAMRYLLGYDVDPLMFHQTNLRAHVGADQALHSLYTDWIDALLDRYTAQLTLPVLTLKLEDIARVMQERGAYDGCGARALLVSDDAGRRLELTAAAACVAPITGLDAPAAGRVEVYGGVPTTFVWIDPCNTVSIPLEAAP